MENDENESIKTSVPEKKSFFCSNAYALESIPSGSSKREEIS